MSAERVRISVKGGTLTRMVSPAVIETTTAPATKAVPSPFNKLKVSMALFEDLCVPVVSVDVCGGVPSFLQEPTMMQAKKMQLRR